MSKEKRSKVSNSDDLRTEYRFDYRKAKPNRFAGRAEGKRVVVALDSDVAKVFRSPEQVNAVLRALIETMPSKKSKKSAVS